MQPQESVERHDLLIARTSFPIRTVPSVPESHQVGLVARFMDFHHRSGVAPCPKDCLFASWGSIAQWGRGVNSGASAFSVMGPCSTCFATFMSRTVPDRSRRRMCGGIREGGQAPGRPRPVSDRSTGRTHSAPPCPDRQTSRCRRRYGRPCRRSGRPDPSASTGAA